jgi:Gas vesicle synthesis protein GvpO
MAESGGDGSRGRLSAKELSLAAMSTVHDLTGYEPEAVTSLEWDGSSWKVTVDALELERIPNTTDLLGSYEVQLDPDGSLMGYKRSRRYTRGQPETEA